MDYFRDRGVPFQSPTELSFGSTVPSLFVVRQARSRYGMGSCSVRGRLLVLDGVPGEFDVSVAEPFTCAVVVVRRGPSPVLHRSVADPLTCLLGLGFAELEADGLLVRESDVA